MKPETVIALRENVPELRELIGFLASEVGKASTNDGMENMSFQERAYEASVRIRTKERLQTILAPLIETGDKPAGIDPNEYVV